jgi:hypothetical protein
MLPQQCPGVGAIHGSRWSDHQGDFQNEGQDVHHSADGETQEQRSERHRLRATYHRGITGSV